MIAERVVVRLQRVLRKGDAGLQVGAAVAEIAELDRKAIADLPLERKAPELRMANVVAPGRAVDVEADVGQRIARARGQVEPLRERIAQIVGRDQAIKAVDPRGRKIYWVGQPGPEQDAGPGTDFYAVNSGYVSVTPLHVDLTHYKVLDELSTWVQPLQIG